MIPFLQWSLTVEIVGGAFLPLTVWLFRAFPDKGFIFSKILGMVLITYLTWLIGSAIPVARSIVLPLIMLIACGGVSWWVLGPDTVKAVRSTIRLIAVEEALFLVAMIVWSVMRAYVFHPGIAHTEQYMDMSFLNASIRSASYPPYDPWMSGHTINYYYMGYLLFGLLIKLSGVQAAVGYNLALSFLFAFTVAATFSLAYTMIRHYVWSLLAPVFVALAGNWHAILVQIPRGHDPSTTYYWFWDSTRVIGSNTTITEFPFFSFMLGDLHPHVMALPVVLLVLALAVRVLLDRARMQFERSVASLLPWFILAVTVGMLFTLNSWDFPTYLLVSVACVAAHGYITDDSRQWWRLPVLVSACLAAGSLVLYTPFYLQFQSLTHGLGFVSTPSDMGEFIQVFGLLLLPAAVFVGSLALLFQPTGDVAEVPQSGLAGNESAAEAGRIGIERGLQYALYGVVFVVAMVGAHFHLWVMLLLLGLGAAGVFVLHRVLNAEALITADAISLIFIAVACLVVAIPEAVYVRDSFDGSSSYRMNTVFKFYYQGWVLLGIAGAYATYRTWHVLRTAFSPLLGWGAALLIAVGTLGGLFYTVNAPQSANQGGIAQSLDGTSSLQATAPGDYAAVQWLRANVSGTPVELEATGGEYDARFARIATFTGLPTVMGWAGHEYQWRGDDPNIAVRVADIKTAYTTTHVRTAEAILRRYNVRYVIVGSTERQTFPAAGLEKFSHFMRQAFASDGTTVYTW